MARHPHVTAAHARIVVRRVHLWLGLGLGLLFAVLGLTGSALVFYTGIDAALHPAIEAAPGESPPGLASPIWDRALATGRDRWHRPGDKWTLEVTGEGGPIPARYYPAPGGNHADRAMVWFSSDGRRIVRAEPWGGYLMSWLYRLHMQLLAGDLGGRVVGWSGVAMLLFVLVATGVLLALPVVTQALLAPAAIPAPTSANGGGRQIAIVEALGTAHRALPDGRIVFVDVPGAGDAPIRVRLQVPGDPHRRFPGSYVFVDRLSGHVLAVHDIRRAGTGTRVASWIRTLHDGTIGGMVTRVLAVMTGFIPSLLFATGILHWLRRRRNARVLRSNRTSRAS